MPSRLFQYTLFQMDYKSRRVQLEVLTHREHRGTNAETSLAAVPSAGSAYSVWAA